MEILSARRAQYVTLLHEIANKKGLKGDGITVLENIMHVESHFNLIAKNGRSSAKGLFQVINGTWDDYVKLHPNELKSDGRDDPTQQIIFAIYYTQDNIAAMNKAFPSRQLSKGDIYLAHFLGPGGKNGGRGAIDVIREAENHPNTPIKEFLPQKVLDSNSEVFFKMDGNRGLEFKEFTVGDLANWANAKMGEKPKYATNSEPHYRRNKIGIPEVLGDMTMVAIGAVVFVAGYLISEVVGMFSDDDAKSPPPTPRRPPSRSRA
ncbi:MAG: transglycosylase SLT domain-containing protein [Pseudomonadota bacterium]